MRTLRPLAFAAAVVMAPSAPFAECPPPLGDAVRLVLVTTPSMDSAKARLQLFTRADAQSPWSAAGEAEPAVVGKAGLGWGFTFRQLKRQDEPEKFERDKRTPAGVFEIGPSFGFAGSKRPRHIKIEAKETLCVEDPASPHYNTITKRSIIGPQTRADYMSDTSLYRYGLFVGYPSDRASRRGSCIFIHIWQSPDKGTAGCVGLPEDRVRALQDFAAAGAVLAVLPQTALDRFAGCLPDPAAASRQR